MKHLIALLLACLLLAGCAAEAPDDETAAPSSSNAPSISAEAADGLYEAGSPLETTYSGALRVYPLSGFEDVAGVRAMGTGLLVFSGAEYTTLTLLTGELLTPTAQIVLEFLLEPDDSSLQISAGELSFFDPVNRQTVVLDSSLKEVSHIAAPEALVGTPLLSSDRNTLYYCTADSIRAWDLESNLHRRVKEIAYDGQSISGLYLNDAVLSCTVPDGEDTRILLLSAETGQLLYEMKELTLPTNGSRYYAAFPTGMTQALLFGEGDGVPQALTPAELTADCFFLAERNAAVTAYAPVDGSIQLDYYDLETGLRCSSLCLAGRADPLSVTDTADGSVYILLYSEAYGCPVLYRWAAWETNALTVQDSSCYTGTYYTFDEPDLEGLAQCQVYAAALSEEFGIEILIWEDAVAVQPWDYDLEAEYLVPVIRQELTLLEQRLSQYPEGMLTDTASHFTGIRLCLVRSLTGTAESGSTESAAGLQFLDGTDAYLVLAAGDTSQQALYHQLFHLMETHILTQSNAFDQWDELNPSGFSYDYDYQANAQRDSGVYLEGEYRAFVDTFSMSFPKEDRARIMEYAMLPGQEELFQTATMQAKLLALCQGIREAYGLEKSSESYIWEQYLEDSLAYKS